MSSKRITCGRNVRSLSRACATPGNNRDKERKETEEPPAVTEEEAAEAIHEDCAMAFVRYIQ
jgi:hypothetical protein